MARIDLVVGARPNFMKAAPVFRELTARHRGWSIRLIHTGQHYDDRMSALFFTQLDLPRPDLNLGVGPGQHAEQTAKIMMALEACFEASRPRLAMVFGDVNSTLAGAVVASKMQIALAHVEAGLRSFDRTMPEEINRLVTDCLSDLLFVTERSGEANLRREGVSAERIHFVGNPMIDTLMRHREAAARLDVPGQMGLPSRGYVLVTLHRPSNVDTPAALERVMASLTELAGRVPVVFPLHPRTSARLDAWGLRPADESGRPLRMMAPLGYLEFVSLMAQAGAVLTDSGGVQEETTVLGVPCVTLRANTERPSTIEQGTNVLLGTDPDRIVEGTLAAFAGSVSASVPELWDGRAAGRIVDVVERMIG